MQSKTSTLGENISSNASSEADHFNHNVVDYTKWEQHSNCPEDEDMDIPEILEEIIEILLSGLTDTVCLKCGLILSRMW